jgi:hypothetical protein
MKVYENATAEEKKKLSNLRSNSLAAQKVNIEAQNNLGVFLSELQKKYNLDERTHVLDSSEEEHHKSGKVFVAKQQETLAERKSTPAAPPPPTKAKPGPKPKETPHPVHAETTEKK